MNLLSTAISTQGDEVRTESTQDIVGDAASQSSILNWRIPGLPYLQINLRVLAWIKYSDNFANWLRARIQSHIELRSTETLCLVPDNWRADLGESITIVNDDYIPSVTPRKSGMIRIMAAVVCMLAVACTPEPATPDPCYVGYLTPSGANNMKFIRTSPHDTIWFWTATYGGYWNEGVTDWDCVGFTMRDEALDLTVTDGVDTCFLRVPKSNQ